MRLRNFHRVVLAAAALVASVTAPGAQPAPGWQNAWDYLIETVCTDDADRALPGVSPLDGPAACARPRKIAVGERLPYHKRDWPGAGDGTAHPDGYQQSDSFPIRTALGPVVVQTYDFGDAPRAFGRFDAGDGGQLVFFTAGTASIGVTEDGGSGLQFFLGPDCKPRDSWVIVDDSFAARPAGETLARITRRSDLCPLRLGFAFTRWHVQPVGYRDRVQGRSGNIVLSTLVSEHFGGKDVAGADHLERMYFTHELGYTRWERWQNFSVHDRAHERAAAAAIAASGRCNSALGAPDGFAMVDCREWTQIVAPSEAIGDPPNFWVDRLPVIFAPQAREKGHGGEP